MIGVVFGCAAAVLLLGLAGFVLLYVDYVETEAAASADMGGDDGDV